MPLASDFPFLDALWLIFVFFAWLMVFGFVIMCLIDNFRRPDLSGGAKAGWTVLLIVLPLIGALAYQVTRPKDVPYDGPGTVPGADVPNTPTSARDQATHIRTGL
jgi:predicted membrane channel-forming protein YqfA (hemolysin III family)